MCPADGVMCEFEGPAVLVSSCVLSWRWQMDHPSRGSCARDAWVRLQGRVRHGSTRTHAQTHQCAASTTYGSWRPAPLGGGAASFAQVNTFISALSHESLHQRGGQPYPPVNGRSTAVQCLKSGTGHFYQNPCGRLISRASVTVSAC